MKKHEFKVGDHSHNFTSRNDQFDKLAELMKENMRTQERNLKLMKEINGKMERTNQRLEEMNDSGAFRLDKKEDRDIEQIAKELGERIGEEFK